MPGILIKCYECNFRWFEQDDGPIYEADIFKCPKCKIYSGAIMDQ